MKKINFLAIFLVNLFYSQSVTLVKDINPGATGSTPQYLTNYNSKIYFSASNGTNGLELWESDGTTAGTKLVQDFVVGSSGQIPSYLTVFNNKIYYSAISGTPSGLYTYDETNGIKLLNETFKNTSGLFAANNKFYFTSTFLYEMDNNETIKQVSTEVHSNGKYGAVNGKIIFGGKPATSTNNYYQLYVYDGQSTTLLKTINPTSTGIPQNFYYSSALNKVIFSASDNSTEPWISDGTEAGTYKLKDLYSDSDFSSSSPNGFTQVGDKVVFAATNYSNGGIELYVTDGTEAGTKLLKDIYPGSTGSNPSKFTFLNGKVYFFANGGSNDAQLWETDGTAEGTKLTLSLNPGSTNFTIGEMVAKDNVLMVSLKMGVSPGQELYKIDPVAVSLSVDPTSSKKTNLYPNPTHGEVFISNFAKGNFELYDLTGKLVQTGKIGSDSKASLKAQPGIYQLRTTVENGKETTINKVIIK